MRVLYLVAAFMKKFDLLGLLKFLDWLVFSFEFCLLFDGIPRMCLLQFKVAMCSIAASRNMALVSCKQQALPASFETLAEVFVFIGSSSRCGFHFGCA